MAIFWIGMFWLKTEKKKKPLKDNTTHSHLQAVYTWPNLLFGLDIKPKANLCRYENKTSLKKVQLS